MSKLTEFEKNKIWKSIDKLFGKSKDPDREEIKRKIFRGLIGDYTDEELKKIKEEEEILLQKIEQETVLGIAPAEESVVIQGKLMSANIIENDNTITND